MSDKKLCTAKSRVWSCIIVSAIYTEGDAEHIISRVFGETCLDVNGVNYFYVKTMNAVEMCLAMALLGVTMVAMTTGTWNKRLCHFTLRVRGQKLTKDFKPNEAMPHHLPCHKCKCEEGVKVCSEKSICKYVQDFSGAHGIHPTRRPVPIVRFE